MSIVLVGGHDRMHCEYKCICRKHGCKLKVYTQLPTKFDKLIGNPDAIILFTKTVSHKMVKVAIKEAKKKKIKVIRCHNSSCNALEDTLQELKCIS